MMMSRPRRSIRRKLFVLLALIGLGPLLLLAWIDLRALDQLGGSLAEELARSLSEQTRTHLVQQAESEGRLFARELAAFDTALRQQDDLVSQALSNPPPAATPDGERWHFEWPAGARQERGQHAVAALASLAPVLLALDDRRHPLRREVLLDSGLHAVLPANASGAFLRAPAIQAWSGTATATSNPLWLELADGERPQLTGVLPLHAANGARLGLTSLGFPWTSLVTRVGGGAPPVHGSTLVLVRVSPGEGLEVLASRDAAGRIRGEEGPDGLLLDARGRDALVAALNADREGETLAQIRSASTFCIHRPLGVDHVQLVWLVPARLATESARAAGDYALANTRRHMDAVMPFVLTVATIIGLLAVYAARTVTDPVSQLNAVVHAVAEGDFTARANIHTGDEMETLGRDFNLMVPQLAEQARMHESLSLAREVQQRMLPSAPPSFPGIDLAGTTRYCEQTGGDYFDFLDGRPYGRDTLGVVVGDVAGHGVPAALLMTTARALLHGMAGYQADPAASLRLLNEQLAADVRPGHFMTLFIVRVDLTARQFLWACAGHDPALWWHAKTGTLTELAGADIPLGIDPAWQFAASVITGFDTGDVLLLATDGVWDTRAPTGDHFGKERLREILLEHHARPASEIAGETLAALDAFSGGAASRDDLTVVVLRIDG